MKASAFFTEASRLPIATLHELIGDGGLVVVAPHPDDESLGCGGLIAAAVEAGRSVRVVVVSDGVGSHPGSRSHPPVVLRALREDETRTALGNLGLAPDRTSFLRLPDRFVPVEGEASDGAIAAIRQAAADCKASTVVVTWVHDPHCDHLASARLVSAASRGQSWRVLHYPVWGWTLADDVDIGASPVGWRFAIDAYRRRKTSAIAAHRSQTTDLIADDPHGFRLEPAMLAHFAGPFETFLVPDGNSL